jgi:hypothetical protein
MKMRKRDEILWISTQLTGAFGVSGFDLDATYGKGAFLRGR